MSARLFPRWPSPPGERRIGRELLDDPDLDHGPLADNIADLRRVNRWLWGWSTLRTELLASLPGSVPGTEMTLLDVGAGSGDLAVAACRLLEDRGWRCRAVVVDRQPAVARIAAEHTAGRLGPGVAVADALRIPLPDDAVDVSFCSALLHHFSGDEAVQVLREMARVARVAVVAVDLRRGWLPYWGAQAALRLLRLSRVSLHDGPLSVARSFTAGEFRELARRAGLARTVVRRHAGYRVALRGVPPAGGRRA